MPRNYYGSTHDYRRVAARVLPRMMFEYIDNGALDETTHARNVADFELLRIRQAALVTGTADTTADVMGHPSSLPLALAPVGSLGIMYPRGEILAFRAAHAAGFGACLSSFSICSIEDVAPEVGPRDAFQLYLLKDPARTDEIVARAAAAGFRNLVVTVDTTHPGMRDCDLRNGYRSSQRLDLRLAIDALRHPRWLARSWSSLGKGLGNYGHWPDVGRGLFAQATHMGRQLKGDLRWSDVAALARSWQGRLIVKGITTVEDVGHAIDAGARSVVVSNHGGRQLEGGVSSIAALPPIADAYAGRVEILFDGGIRRGTHLFKALAAGADACLLGRAYAYAIAAEGEAGVTSIAQMLQRELVMTMVLAGCPDIRTLREKRGAFLVA